MSNVKQLKDASGNSFSPKTSIDALTSTGGGGNFLTTKQINGETKVVDTEIAVDSVFRTVTVGQTTTGEPYAPASVTNSGTGADAVLDFVIPKGNPGHNPNLGTYVTTDNGATFTPSLPLLPQDPQSHSDFIVVVDKTDPSNVTATIWTWDDTLATPTWVNTGRDANMAYFGSGELISDVNIDSTNLVNPVEGSLPKAEDVMQLKAKLEGVTTSEVKVNAVIGTNVTTDAYVSGETGLLVTNKPGYAYFELAILQGTKSIRFATGTKTSGAKIGYSIGYYDNGTYVPTRWFYFDVAEITPPTGIVEKVIEVLEGETTFMTTVAADSTYASITLDAFYCYLQSGESVVEKLANKVEVNKVPYVDYSQYCVWDSTKVIRGTNATPQSSTYGNAGYTDFIPVDGVKGLYCSNPFAKGSGSTIFFGCYVYNSSKGLVRSIGQQISTDTSKWYIKQEGDAYVRFNLGEGATISELTNDMIVTPSNISNYEALKISEGAVVDNKRLFVKVTGKNLCNPDKLTIQTGLFIAYASGNVSYNSSNTTSKGITDFIPMNGKSVVCNHAVKSGNIGYAVYDENYHYIRGGQSSNVSYQEGDCYVMFSLNATSEIQVEYGTVSTEYESYTESVCINEEMIPDKEKELVTVNDITPTTQEPISDNLCNPEDINNTGYISGNSGNFVQYSNYAATGYIPIDEEGLHCGLSVVAGNYIGYAYYSDNVGTRIEGYYNGNYPSGCTKQYAAYVDGAKYVRFTISRNSSNVMINKGNVEKPYVAYAGYKKVISKEILPHFNNDSKTNYENGVSIVLPSNIYCTKGDTLYLYWRSFIEAVNPKVFDCCSPNSTTTNNVLSYPDCLKITRTSDTPFNVVVRDNALNEVAKKTVNFKAVNAPTSPASAVNVLLVGASREANGVTPLEVYRRLVGDNTMSPSGLGLTNINFVGRKGCKAYDCEQLGYQSSLYSQVKHEAVSGKKIHDMVVAGDLTGYTFYFEPNEDYVFNQGDKYTDGTRVYTVVGSDPAAGDLQVSISSGSGTPSATGTLTLTEGSGTASVDYTSYENETSNPFWNSSTGKIDFAKYSTDYCNGATIDILVLCRVMNDLWNGRTPSQVVADYTTVIDAFHEYNPSGYVIINLAVLPSMYGGLPHSYTNGKPLSTAWYAARLNLETHKLLIELGESDDYKDFCLLSNSNAEFDLDYFYSKEATTIRNRGTSKTVNYDNNGLHFSATGKQVVADSIYHCVCKIINEINS